ncbi:MAG TPA: glycoside hydrolase family 16 protein [Pyrinomonadaceae bacterium]|nr:glycoside hydrolase family 16 protein [Pyrinomonadaceae bacterium]
MLTYRLAFTLILCLVACSSVQQPPKNSWQLVWSDEFDYTGLPDSSKWRYDVGGHGWGNKELQNYTDRRQENARVENGVLIIEARRDGGKANPYTSARIVTKTKGDWTYGRFEVRAKLPSGRGTWPAIWMLPTQRSYGQNYWPDNGEIDIMEHVGYEPDVIHFSAHTKAYYHSINTQKTAKTPIESARSGFNVYAVEWTPQEIRWYVNDREYFKFNNERLSNPAADYKQWPFDKPFHILLNLAVGGTWGGRDGVDESIWPQRMEVDYVRVYKEQR